LTTRLSRSKFTVGRHPHASAGRHRDASATKKLDLLRLPTLKATELIRALEKAGFKTMRQKGSHDRLVHADGRVVTAPLHPGHDIGRGLLRKILRDAELSRDEFIALLK
jgi:predicted RNA binding protein YcfA (HicA-like mRNA interferase family)